MEYSWVGKEELNLHPNGININNNMNNMNNMNNNMNNMNNMNNNMNNINSINSINNNMNNINNNTNTNPLSFDGCMNEACKSGDYLPNNLEIMSGNGVQIPENSRTFVHPNQKMEIPTSDYLGNLNIQQNVSEDSYKAESDSLDGSEVGSKNHKPSFSREDSAMSLSKKKEQNRTAQRAFRERREKQIQGLQEKLSALENEIVKLKLEKEYCKKEAEWYCSEYRNLIAIYMKNNESIKNNQSIQPTNVTFVNKSNNLSLHVPKSENQTMTIPDAKSQFFEFYGDLVGPHIIQLPLPHSIESVDESGDKLVSAVGVWEMIQSHPKTDKVDFLNVKRLLSDKARCGGMGPVYSYSDVLAAIESSIC